MEIANDFPRNFLSGENGEKGYAGFVFIFLLFSFMIPMMLLEFNIGRNLIAKEGVLAAMDTAVLSGANENQRVDDTFGPYGQATSWHYEIIQSKALLAAQEAFERNVENLKLKTNFKTVFLLPQPTFTFPKIDQMSGSIPFTVDMDDFNKANSVLNPKLVPSPVWEATGDSRSVFSQPKFN